VSAVPEIMLNNGRLIPQFGFGVFQVRPADTEQAVTAALEADYPAVARSGRDRSDLFITTKLSNASHRPDDARRAFAGSLEALGLDYVDLFLIHWACPTSRPITCAACTLAGNPGPFAPSGRPGPCARPGRPRAG
jgi:2,5-diketo-D-gluconate reductase A